MPPPPPPAQTQRTRQGHGANFAQPRSQKRGGDGSKQQQQRHPPIISPAVTALQKLISHIQHPPPKSVPHGSCFCQSRTHPLSLYTPQCMSCGLVLCSLNPPFHPCPFEACNAPLLADHAKRALVDQLSAQIAQTIADEEDARRREDEARVRAAGAFPELGATGGSGGNNNNNINTLSSASTQQQPRVVVAAAAKASYNTTRMQEPQQQQQQQQFHKVISLSGKGKVTATYTRISPSPSSASLHAKAKEEDTVRVPPPPEGPEYVKLDPADFISKKRLYEDLRGEGPIYIPLPSEEKVTSDAREGSGRRKRPRKKKQGKENQPQVLEAGPSGHS